MSCAWGAILKRSRVATARHRALALAALARMHLEMRPDHLAESATYVARSFRPPNAVHRVVEAEVYVHRERSLALALFEWDNSARFSVCHTSGVASAARALPPPVLHHPWRPRVPLLHLLHLDPASFRHARNDEGEGAETNDDVHRHCSVRLGGAQQGGEGDDDNIVGDPIAEDAEREGLGARLN